MRTEKEIRQKIQEIDKENKQSSRRGFGSFVLTAVSNINIERALKWVLGETDEL